MAFVEFDISLLTDALERCLNAHRYLQFVKGEQRLRFLEEKQRLRFVKENTLLDDALESHSKTHRRLRVSKGSQRLKFVKETLKQGKTDYKLKKFLKFAHQFYLNQTTTQLQDYHHLIQEKYSNVDPDILTMLINLPEKILATCLIPSWNAEGKNLRDTLCSQINNEIKDTVLQNLSGLPLRVDYSFNYIRYHVDRRYLWYYYEGSSAYFLPIMLVVLIAFIGLALGLIIIAAIEGWLLLCFPLITMGLLLLGFTFGLCLAFQHDQRFVGMDTLVSDLGSPEHLEYTSLKFRCLYALGLQRIGTASTQCLDYFETTSLMKSHAHLMITVTKSKLNEQDILSFILSLPPMALTDDRLFAAIMLLLKHRHDTQAVHVMHALQGTLENHTPKTPNERFSLAIIHRSGLSSNKIVVKRSSFFRLLVMMILIIMQQKLSWVVWRYPMYFLARLLCCLNVNY